MGEYVGDGAAPGELWRHPAPTSTPMWQFIERVNSKRGLSIKAYPALYKWSVENTSAFWEDVWDFVGIVASKKADKVRQCLVLPLTLQPP